MLYLPLGCVLSNDTLVHSVLLYPLPLEALTEPYRGIYEGVTINQYLMR